MSAVRDRMVDLANAAVGLGFGRDNREDYLDLIAHGEAGSRAYFGKMSSCGLVVRGLWRQLGLDDPRLRAPYKPGSVLATIQDMAREAGAWLAVHNGDAALPQEGDVIALDFDAPTAHVATIVRVMPGIGGAFDGATLFTVDGGQRDGTGAETVLRRQRTITVGAGGVFLDAQDYGPPSVRHFSGWVDLDALAARFLPGGAPS